MARSTEVIKQQTALRDKYKAELEARLSEVDAARARLEAAEAMLRAASGQPEPAKAPRSNVKGLILSLLGERGAEGVNANVVVDTAAQRGERVERGTASSLLSRFKAEGLVVYDGKVYRLAKFAVAPPIEETSAMH